MESSSEPDRPYVIWANAPNCAQGPCIAKDGCPLDSVPMKNHAGVISVVFPSNDPNVVAARLPDARQVVVRSAAQRPPRISVPAKDGAGIADGPTTLGRLDENVANSIALRGRVLPTPMVPAAERARGAHHPELIDGCIDASSSGHGEATGGGSFGNGGRDTFGADDRKM